MWLAAGLPIAALLAAASVQVGDAEQRVRGAGMLMTLAGVVLVARGIADTRATFGRRTYRQRFVAWIKRRPRVFVQRPVTVHAGVGRLSLSGLGTVAATGSVRNLSTVEGRLQALEEDVRRIDERISTTAGELRAEIAGLRTSASDEQSSRVAGDRQLRQLLEDVGAGGLDVEAVGVVWVIAGEIFGSFSGEIAARL